jgi:AraC-like DNA-binding protein
VAHSSGQFIQQPKGPSLLSFRSYGATYDIHAHGYVQIVLPVLGELEVEVEGLSDKVDARQGIFIAPSMKHCQSANGVNRFLILDFESSHISEQLFDCFTKTPRLEVSGAAHYLIHYLGLSSEQKGSVDSSIAKYAVPLLLDALLDAPSTPASRLSSLLCRIEQKLGEYWSVARMAGSLEISESRLYAIFQNQLQTSPQAWLTEVRIRHAQHLLAHTDRPIAEIALYLGYSDQTALTRAMRRRLQRTPAEFRRSGQQ